MSPPAAVAAEAFRRAFAVLDTLDSGDVDELVLAVIGHLRAIRPASVLVPAGSPNRMPTRGGSL